MATPAAVLSILVKAQGVQAASGQLGALDKAGRKAGTGLATTEKQAKRTSRSFSLVGSAAKSAGLLVGGVGLAAGIKTAVGEFREAQKVGAQTSAVLKSTGNAAKTSRKQIEDLAGSISKKSGIDDEAIQSGENLLLTFTKIRNETGAGNKIFDQATQIITDMSVSLKQGLKPSAIQVGKALNDPIKGITALRRVGVSFTAQQEKQIKKMVESGDLLGAQRRILKELRTEFGGSAAAQATAGDKLSVSLHNLAEAAGGILVPMLDKAAVALTNLINDFIEGKGIAKVIIPTFFSVRDAIASVIPVVAQVVTWFRTNNTVATLVAAAFATIKAAASTLLTIFKDLIGVTKGFALALKEGQTWAVTLTGALVGLGVALTAIKVYTLAVAAATRAYAAAQAVLNAVQAVNPMVALGVAIVVVVGALVALEAKTHFVEKAWRALSGAFASVLNWLKSNWPTVLAILTGPIGLAVLAIVKNWDTIKRAFQTGVAAMVSTLRGAVGAITNAGKALGQGVINGFKSALNIAHEVAQAVRDTIAKAVSFGIGIGRKLVEGIVNGIKSAAGSITGAVGSAAKDVAGAINPFGEGIGKKLGIVPMKAPGSLMGARRSMAPFAAVGAANGLHVSSGLRRGAITSSGNTSYHSTGEAVDLAGSPAGMLKTFRTLRSRFGSRLAELIYTPGGIGIKNGQPHTYTGQVAADHFDHVHVAFDTGIPGVGDGFGKAQAALFAGTGDGPGKLSLQQLANLWVKAGGSPKMAGLMARIAMAESGGDPGARNKSGATGLWQILGAMVKGNLTDPLVNARNAVAKYKAQGLGAWSASRSVWGQYVGHPGVKASTSARRAGAAAAGKINPYDLAIAQADVAIASAKGGKLGGVGGRRFSADMAKYYAILAKEKVIGARIRKIRGALKGKLTKGTRLRLTQELAQLLPEHRQLALDRAAIKRGPAPADTSAGADVGGGGGDTGDPNQPLIDAINAAAEQQRQHDELIKQQIALQETIRDEQRKFNSVSTSNYNVLSKAIADVANREIGGGIGLGFMSPGYPGGGVRY